MSEENNKSINSIREEKKALKLAEERLRLKAMFSYEDMYKDKDIIVGIDEAGRGPLAGPVVAGAVVLDRDREILYLNDSKKLSQKKREMLFEEIKDKALFFGIGIIDPSRIDQINILNATYEAMRDAVMDLGASPDIFLNDAVIIPFFPEEKQVKIIKGDAKSASIAAASIIAKVTRDRMMADYDVLYPEYGFAKNKGYGTAEHIKALKEYGPCPIHRRSFIGNFVGNIVE